MKIQEINVVRKVNYNNKYIKFALCYPNVYRAGISNFAVQLIYRLLNDVPDIACERYFYDHSGKPVSIENNLSLKSFDVIGFSLQYELDYFNVINILKAANIPIYAKNRRRPL
ncbi:MAG: radical SAM protein, partial [Candidatus Helarchaeota archaeon]